MSVENSYTGVFLKKYLEESAHQAETISNKSVKTEGYVELTGYAGTIGGTF